VQQGIGDLFVRRPDKAGKGGAGDPHPFRRLLMVGPVQIGKPYRLDLVERHNDLLKHA
jgi:hypothetical protein